MKNAVPSSSRSILPIIMLAIFTLAVLAPNQASGQSQWTTNGTDISNTNSGNVGIGTSTPTAKLEVNGTVKIAAPGGALSVRNTDTWTQIVAARTGSYQAAFIAVPSAAFSVTNPYWAMGLSPDGSTGWSLDTWDGASMITRMRVLAGSGNVGIGTTSPLAQLHLGTSSNNGLKTYASSPTDHGLLFNSYIDANPPYRRYADIVAMSNQDGISGGSIIRFLTNPNNSFTASERMRIDYLGNVGIGTSTPGQKLVVYGGADTALQIGDRSMSGSVGLQFLGSGYKHAALRFDGDNLVVENASNSGLPSTWHNGQPMNLVIRNGNLNVAAGGLCIAGDCKTSWSQVGGGGSGASAAANVSAGQFGANTGGGNFSFPASVLLSGSTGAFIDSGANNRFRVCGPNATCSVAGEYIGGRIRLSADGSFASAEAAADPGMGGINAPGNAYLGGNVGVGTTAPTRNLSVNAAATSYMSFNESGAEKAVIGTEAAAPYNRRFIIYDSTAAAYRMVIDNAGKVGIGTTTPTAKLDVQGDINVTGNINAKYQDVAEWVQAAKPLSAGTVVVLNPDKSNQVMACSTAYDTRVAGVVSERPGISLGEAGKDKVLVATTGRVRVKVDATHSPIRVGDLLVTSDVEGVAMKSAPVDLGGVRLHRPGTLIGKALEPLESGTGEILVLLSLQ